MSSTRSPSKEEWPLRSALRNLSNSNTVGRNFVDERCGLEPSLPSKYQSPTGKLGEPVSRRLTFSGRASCVSNSSMANRTKPVNEDSSVLPFSIYEDCDENEVRPSNEVKKQRMLSVQCESPAPNVQTAAEELPSTGNHESASVENCGGRVVDCATQTRMTDEEVDGLLFSDEPSAEYYKQLAEARRVALKDSLRENETLHREIAALREENAKLRTLADQAEYFATVARALLSEADGDADLESERQTDVADDCEVHETELKAKRQLNSTRNENDSDSALFDSAVSAASCSALSSLADNSCE